MFTWIRGEIQASQRSSISKIGVVDFTGPGSSMPHLEGTDLTVSGTGVLLPDLIFSDKQTIAFILWEIS